MYDMILMFERLRHFVSRFYVARWSRYSSPMAEELRLSKLVTSEDRNVEKRSRFEVFEV